MPGWNQLPLHLMTPTSATKSDGDPAAASELLSVIAKRASHEVRNALNAVAVNVEVVRSRMSRPEPDLAELQTFADRASKETDAAVLLATGLADLVRLLARAATGKGTATVSSASGSTTVSVPISSSDDTDLSTDLIDLAMRIGVGIKVHGPAVIFTVRD